MRKQFCIATYTIERLNHHALNTVELMERGGCPNLEPGLQAGLKHVGIGEKDIEKLCTDTINQTRLLINNPKTARFDDAVDIYKA